MVFFMDYCNGFSSKLHHAVAYSSGDEEKALQQKQRENINKLRDRMKREEREEEARLRYGVKKVRVQTQDSGKKHTSERIDCRLSYDTQRVTRTYCRLRWERQKVGEQAVASGMISIL